MTTSLESNMILLSKQMGDYWTGTTTSGTDSTSVIDTALKAKANDWITDDAYDRLTSGDYDEEERKITSLDSSAGDLTVLAHGGTVASGVTYEVHRLFTASEKRRALVHGAKTGFPHIFKQIWDESKAIDDDDLYKEIDISTLGLAQNRPHQIWQSSDKTDDSLRWYPIRNYTIDKDGNLWLYEGICGYDLRIVGIGYLDFYDTEGDVGTDWEDTIAIDSPQTEILIAEAAIYLCNQMIIPNFTSGESEGWIAALRYWQAELKDRRGKFGMVAPSATTSWRV